MTVKGFRFPPGGIKALRHQAEAVIHSVQKAMATGRKADEPSRGGLSQVRSARGGKAGTRARAYVKRKKKSAGTVSRVRSARGGAAGGRARKYTKRKAAYMRAGSAEAKRHMAKLRKLRKRARGS